MGRLESSKYYRLDSVKRVRPTAYLVLRGLQARQTWWESAVPPIKVDPRTAHPNDLAYCTALSPCQGAVGEIYSRQDEMMSPSHPSVGVFCCLLPLSMGDPLTFQSIAWPSHANPFPRTIPPCFHKYSPGQSRNLSIGLSGSELPQKQM